MAGALPLTNSISQQFCAAHRASSRLPVSSLLQQGLQSKPYIAQRRALQKSYLGRRSQQILKGISAVAATEERTEQYVIAAPKRSTARDVT